MKVVIPSYEILTPISENGIEELKKIERIGRVCYKSEDRITEDGESAKKFVQNLVNMDHGAMLEHSQISVMFSVDRGVTHELVRHRLSSFAQESTRYVKYSLEKNGGQITVVIPTEFLEEKSSEEDLEFHLSKNYTLDDIDNVLLSVTENGEVNSKQYQELLWCKSCLQSEKAYIDMINNGASAQLARSVLPTSLKANLTMTANYREWRTIFKLRADKAHAHPDMYWIMSRLLKDLKGRIPVIFDDIYPDIV